MGATPALMTPGPGGGFVAVTIPRRAVGPRDVLIDIAYCGVCHSDVSYARNEWGKTLFPLVPGHEIAGTVAAVGSDVSRFAVGDRVGVGCLVETCGSCENCQAGQHQHCYGTRVSTYSARDRAGGVTLGGYSKQIVVDEGYVLRIPDALALERAAPLLCAGITVYSPLVRWGAGPGKRVGIIGLGGLGHVAVQLSRALGARTVAFELSEAKRDDALRLGAEAFVDVQHDEQFGALAHSLDLIICTVPANVDLDRYLGLLALGGTFVVIGVPRTALTIEPFSLIINQRALAGSRIGGLPETQEMLDFCAAHGVAAEVEIIEAGYVAQAFDRLAAGDVRFRFALDVASIPDDGQPVAELEHLAAGRPG